jgi:hypothetical protein
MTNIYFTTVYRYAPNNQAGELVRLDWENKKVLNRVFVGPKSLEIDDPNPRGNSRGGRGVVVVGGKIYAASYCELQVYDQDFNLLRIISHPLMAGLHEIYKLNEQQLWITSTSLDCALLIDLVTDKVIKSFWPREIRTYQDRWNLTPQPLDKQADNRLKHIGVKENKDPNHTHFNAVSVWNDEVFGLLNRFGAVINLSTEKVLIEDKNIWGCHNLQFSKDGVIFINDTRNQGVHIFDSKGNFVKRINLLPFHPIGKKVKLYKKTAPLRVFLENKKIIKHGTVMPFFVRGLDLVGDHLFIGISPAAILCIDWRSEKLIDVFNYSSDIRMAVHGLKVD